MKASELKLTKEGYNLSCGSCAPRSHYKFIMDLGRCFPSTKAQARHFVSKGIYLDVLNGDDVEKVEALLKKHGFEGDYKPTKSNRWVRLQNDSDLWDALKIEFSL